MMLWKKMLSICLVLCIAVTVVLLESKQADADTILQTDDVNSSGDLYSFGDSGRNLGHGDGREKKVPTKVESLSRVKAVDTNDDIYYQATFVLLENGDVYSFGEDGAYLGHGDTKGRLEPTKIESLSNVKAISTGYNHTLVLLENGDVYSFGWWGGKTGHGDGKGRLEPTKIESLSNVKAVSAGAYHSLVLLENGDVYSFGGHGIADEEGMLGHGDTKERLIPTKIESISKAKYIEAGSGRSFVVLENGDIYSFGISPLGQGDWSNRLTPTKIDGLSNVKAVSSGSNHTLVLLENGDVYSFGYIGEHLGLGDLPSHQLTPKKIEGLSNAKAISAGRMHSLVLLENGDVYSFGGGNVYLGHGEFNLRIWHSTPKKIESISNAIAIEAGHSNSFIIVDNKETSQSAEPVQGKEFKPRNADKAEALKPLGVFVGTDKGFELERPATRMEAAVMLTRLLGKEEQARGENNPHPFEDVPEWGGFYIGYLYKNGLAAGVSESQFGSDGKCTAQMYVTFILRALGYSDKDGEDFTYADALDFAVQIGLISAGQRDEWLAREFLRDDLAGISYDALKQVVKEGGQTLSEKLFGEDVLE
jgi:alpha-tubulin suppressor-like RCC1 family protein